MKKILILFFTVTGVGLGVLCITQSRRLSGHKEHIAALNGEMERQDRRAEELRATNQRLKRQHRELLEQVNSSEQNHEFATFPSPATAPCETSPPPANGEASGIARNRESAGNRRLV